MNQLADFDVVEDMTLYWGEEPEAAIAFHRFLLRVSSRAPDELVVLARRWLAAGRLAGVAETLAFAAIAGHVAVGPGEARLLAEYGVTTELPRLDGELPLAYGVSNRPERPAQDEDGPDRAAVSVASAVKDAVGLWRAWRLPEPHEMYLPAKRIYLLLARGGPVRLAARLQTTLAEAGETHPLVEVFDDPRELPEFGRRALAAADLLWADRREGEVRRAEPFDAYDAAGAPAFAEDRPRLADAEATRVAVYLANGAPLLTSPDLAPDGLDRLRGRIVPTGLRGDGRWIWSDADMYYLSAYGIAPDADLLAAIRGSGYRAPTVDAVDVHRSRKALLDGRTAASTPTTNGLAAGR